MDGLTFTSEIIKSISWPITAVVLVYLLRTPLSNLIQLIMKIKYKDLEIWFNQEIKRIESRIPAEELKQVKEITADEDKKIKKLVKTSPAQVILDSWDKTELVVYEKMKKLFPPDSLQLKRLTKDRASTELLLSGALSPYVENILQELEFFRNRVAHSPEQSVPNEVALKYYDLCKFIQNKVDSLTELPAVKLTPLTLMILSINSLIDKGKYNNISIDEIEQEIEKGTILKFLKEKAGSDIDLSIILNGTTYPGFKEFYIDNLQRLCNAYSGNERRKWGVENLGLCLLLAWTNEIIQQGSGWHPSD